MPISGSNPFHQRALEQVAARVFLDEFKLDKKPGPPKAGNTTKAKDEAEGSTTPITTSPPPNPSKAAQILSNIKEIISRFTKDMELPLKLIFNAGGDAAKDPTISTGTKQALQIAATLQLNTAAAALTLGAEVPKKILSKYQVKGESTKYAKVASKLLAYFLAREGSSSTAT